VVEPSQAHFALYRASLHSPHLNEFALGDPRYPERSTTVLVLVDSMLGGPVLSLSGPGVLDSVDIQKSVKSGQGKGEIEQSARYVKATFICIRVNKDQTISQKMTVKETIKWILTVGKVVKGYHPEYNPDLPGSSSQAKGGKSTGRDVMNCPVFK
jgi:hypothetical protein